MSEELERKATGATPGEINVVSSAKFCIRNLADLLAVMDGRTFMPGTIEREIVKRSGEVMADLVRFIEGDYRTVPCYIEPSCGGASSVLADTSGAGSNPVSRTSSLSGRRGSDELVSRRSLQDLLPNWSDEDRSKFLAWLNEPPSER